MKVILKSPIQVVFHIQHIQYEKGDKNRPNKKER